MTVIIGSGSSTASVALDAVPLSLNAITLNLWSGLTATTGFATTDAAGPPPLQARRVGGTIGDKLTWDRWMGGGTWDMVLWGASHADAGVVSVLVDEVLIGTLDWTGSTNALVAKTLSNFTVGKPGVKRIKIEITARRVVTFHPSDKLRDSVNRGAGGNG